MTQQPTGASPFAPAPGLRSALSILVVVGLLPLISEGCGPPS